ncbi:uncharacterized protein M421DRAFT_139271 [Didymella exigua CBS 183.55]|uniref:Uncharacterized protein n=1 Tax=Didymella exigua CBS 183.55 TaxID=1150837 RepID=A0A6A5RPW9_9PLEO|nr:uncharacterized protein M421DRAFT_139271 [Didymella exigua CBS 183.55]KAF1929463.1 hypothetical protein M421DRAFT_139271 [Didymella exigua CBS 183.55]
MFVAFASSPHLHNFWQDQHQGIPLSTLAQYLGLSLFLSPTSTFAFLPRIRLARTRYRTPCSLTASSLAQI